MKPSEEEVGTFSAVEKEAAEALRPVLESRQPSRFRLMRVVCEQQHGLLDVYATAAGPVVTTWETFGAITGRTVYRGRPVVEFLHRPRDLELWWGVLAACRCRQATVERAWLNTQLGEGRRRAVWPTARNRRID